MEFQAKTVGNATLVVNNKDSTILVTDPWFDEHSCYFGSWRLTHEIPREIKEQALKAKYIWISHFHPDHLNLQTLRLFKQGSKIILAKQFSNRLANQLRKAGFDVIVLPNRKWIELEENLKILTFTDEKQDSVLLVEIVHGNKKTLIVNLNDSSGCGCKNEIRNLSSKYKNSILLELASYGDADMINLFDLQTEKKILCPCDGFTPIGKLYQKSMNDYLCNIAIPFSSSHQYQRADSWWARKYQCEEKDHFRGFKNCDEKKLLPIFQSVSFLKDQDKLQFESINPKKIVINDPVEPSKFGDDWNIGMKNKDKIEINEYFSSIDYLKNNYDSIGVRFGNDTHNCVLNKHNKNRKSILFNSPRRSFMYAIRNEVFDDLLIGNYMKTYLNGTTNLRVPRFDFFVAKLADNAYVKTKNDIEKAFAYYNKDRIMEDRIDRSINNSLSVLKDKILSPKIRAKLKKLLTKSY